MADQPDFAGDLGPEGSEGRYTAVLPVAYQGRKGQPFGGVTAALAVRAAGHEAVHDRPASISLHYVRPLSIATPIDIAVDVLKHGQRSEVRRVVMEQAGKVVVHAVVVAVPSGERDTFPSFDAERHREFPDPHSLPAMADVIGETGFEIGTDHNIRASDARVLKDEAVRESIASDHSSRFVWAASYGVTAVSDDPWVEASRIAVMCDSHATLQRARLAGHPSIPFPAPESGIAGIVNLDLTVHFHPRPRSTPWLWSDGEASVAADGLANGSCTVWSSEGDLLATAVTQVMVIPAGMGGSSAR